MHLQEAPLEGKEENWRNFLDIKAKRRTDVPWDELEIPAVAGGSRAIAGYELGEVHAGTWPAEQTDLRSLHQAGPCVISGLTRGPDQQQGTGGGGEGWEACLP